MCKRWGNPVDDSRIERERGRRTDAQIYRKYSAKEWGTTTSETKSECYAQHAVSFFSTTDELNLSLDSSCLETKSYAQQQHVFFTISQSSRKEGLSGERCSQRDFSVCCLLSRVSLLESERLLWGKDNMLWGKRHADTQWLPLFSLCLFNDQIRDGRWSHFPLLATHYRILFTAMLHQFIYFFFAVKPNSHI